METLIAKGTGYAMNIKDLKEVLDQYPDYFAVAFDGGELGYFEFTGAGTIGEMLVLR